MINRLNQPRGRCRTHGLGPKAWAKMERMYLNGLPLVAIAIAMGCSKQNVHQVLRRRGVPMRPTGIVPKRRSEAKP